MRDFRELKVWHKAHQVALEVYRQSRDFPTDERFGLTAHLRKSATSVASNIVAKEISDLAAATHDTADTILRSATLKVMSKPRGRSNALKYEMTCATWTAASCHESSRHAILLEDSGLSRQASAPVAELQTVYV